MSEVKHDRWTEFLEQVMPSELDRRLFRQWVGYCMVPCNYHRKMLYIYGPEASGKTVLMAMTRAIVGSEMCGYTTPSQLSDTYGFNGLVGRLVNQVETVDCDRPNREAWGRLNRIVNNELVTVNAKYLAPFDTCIFARFMVTSSVEAARFWISGIPHPYKYDFRNNVMEVRTGPTIPELDRRPDMMGYLGEEMYGITRWAIEGMREIIQGRFINNREEIDYATDDGEE